MWRAFFYASGMMLIILGIECIVVGRFKISADSGLSRLAQKAWGNVDATIESDRAEARNLASSYAANQSQFGPSRFNNDPFYNASSNLRQNRDNVFNLPNHNAATSNKLVKKPRTITSEDWMPWSLIAAGAIITLYTKSLNRGSADD
jgi:hypothetical protein